jgi:hypothetical protein
MVSEAEPVQTLNAYRDGKILVVPSGCKLPLNCVKCGAPALKSPLRRTFYWRNPGYYYILLALPFLFPVGAVFVVAMLRAIRKNARVDVPFCQAHRSWRSRMNTVGTALWMGSVPMALLLFALNIKPPLAGLIAPLATAFCGVVVLAIVDRSFYAVYVDKNYAQFKGVGERFLSLLPSNAVSSAAAHSVELRGT